LPEARSPFEKMEMRGEKIDVNSIRQNVKEGMGNVKNRMEAWGEEVKTSAQQFSERAKEFAGTRGKTFANEVVETSRPAGRGCLHVIGVLFKAFFIFVIGSIALALFAGLMAVVFGGIAWWPVNDFLWTSNAQKLSAWGTLLFFLGVPIIALMTWLVRRIVRVRSKSKYLGWIFGGLWTIGWVCAVAFAISVAKDLREYEKISQTTATVSPQISKMIVKVNEPAVRYGGNIWWIHDDNTGWDISDNTMKYDNVKIRFRKSDDSSFHVILNKYSAGSSVRDAQDRAQKIVFNASVIDSVLNLSSGLAIDSRSKFRGQGVIVEIQIPVGKQVQFDRSVRRAYSYWVVRDFDDNYDRDYGNRYAAKHDWDNDWHFDWDPDVTYTMNEKGQLVDPNKKVKKDDEDENTTNEDEVADKQIPTKDSLQKVRLEQKRVRDSIDREIRNTDLKLREKRTGMQQKNGAPSSELQFPYISILI